MLQVSNFFPISPTSVWGLVQIIQSDLVLFFSESLLMWAPVTLLQRKDCRFWQWVTLEPGVKDSLVRTRIRLLQHWMVGTVMIDLECIDQLRQSYSLPSLLPTPTGLEWWEVSFDLETLLTQAFLSGCVTVLPTQRHLITSLHRLHFNNDFLFFFFFYTQLWKPTLCIKHRYALVNLIR